MRQQNNTTKEKEMTSRWIFTTGRYTLLWGTLAVIIPMVAAVAMAASSSHGEKATHGQNDTTMDHQEMSGQFKHDMMVEGVKAEFQIMSLESMNMKDPDGATHHVMVKFMDAESGKHIEEAVGRIKVISPSKAETVVDLKDYSGIYAANVTFDEPGKYGVICLAKVAGQKPLYKFWYPHP
jgi:predicted membrane protein